MLSNLDWGAKRVFVTGATGVVGSWLAKELVDRNAHVVALVKDTDRRSEFYLSGCGEVVSTVNGNLEDYWTVERAINEHEIDSVFHLGAQAIVGTAHRSPLPTFETNIRGTYNLLEACRIHSDRIERIVIASSDKAYGEQSALPYTEDMTLGGKNPYEVSKSCADMIGQSYHYTYGLPVGIARCGNVYGGGDLNWNRIVPGTIRSVLQGKRPIIRSDGSYVRDYVYVRDVALAYMSLAEGLGDKTVDGEAFNFGNDSPVSVSEIVSLVQVVTGRTDLEPDVQNVAVGEIHDQYLSSEKARSVLGWNPSYDMETGLAETVEWYREFLAV